jgi:hypothetical protein
MMSADFAVLIFSFEIEMTSLPHPHNNVQIIIANMFRAYNGQGIVADGCKIPTGINTKKKKKPSKQTRKRFLQFLLFIEDNHIRKSCHVSLLI